MRIDEYIEPDALYRFGSDGTDQYKKSDTRRPRLTLRHLNKLRKIRDLRRIEQQQHDKLVAWMYKVPAKDEKKKKKE